MHADGHAPAVAAAAHKNMVSGEAMAAKLTEITATGCDAVRLHGACPVGTMGTKAIAAKKQEAQKRQFPLAVQYPQFDHFQEDFFTTKGTRF